MLTPIFPIITASSAVTTLLGTSPTRFYPFGEAPQGVTYPYATWTLISGTPENMLDEAPGVDAHRVQVDVWSRESTSCDAVATAVRNALEASAYMVDFGNDKDPTTGSYRIRMDFEFWISR